MSKRLELEEVKERIRKDTRCELISKEYKNNKTKLKFRCECGNVFENTLDAMRVRKKQCCNQCASKERSKKLAKSQETFEKEILKRLGRNYKVLGGYKNTNTNIDIKHDCGYIWNVRPSSILNQNAKCPNCYGNNIKKTTEKFKKEVYILVGKEFKVLGTYKHAKAPILMKHMKCNNTWEVQPSNFLAYHSCIFCSPKSRGEDEVAKVLDKININYTKEKRFHDCKNKRMLPFDFYLYNHNIAIEYDGIQHFKPSFNEKEFRNIKINDEIKNKYCEEKNINLIRIPYWDFENIETILKRALT